MHLEMIINGKVACKWVRARDYALFAFSWLLWGAMLSALVGFELSEASAKSYLYMVGAVGTGLVAWEQGSKALFYYRAKQTVAQRLPFLAWPVEAEALAGHFGLPAEYLYSLQRKKCAVIYHSNAGHIADVAVAARDDGLVCANQVREDRSQFSRAA